MNGDEIVLNNCIPPTAYYRQPESLTIINHYHPRISSQNIPNVCKLNPLSTIKNCLVVEPYPSEKYEFVSWERWHPIYEMEKIEFMFQSTNQIR